MEILNLMNDNITITILLGVIASLLTIITIRQQKRIAIDSKIQNEYQDHKKELSELYTAISVTIDYLKNVHKKEILNHLIKNSEFKRSMLKLYKVRKSKKFDSLLSIEKRDMESKPLPEFQVKLDSLISNIKTTNNLIQHNYPGIYHNTKAIMMSIQQYNMPICDKFLNYEKPYEAIERIIKKYNPKSFKIFEDMFNDFFYNYFSKGVLDKFIQEIEMYWHLAYGSILIYKKKNTKELYKIHKKDKKTLNKLGIKNYSNEPILKEMNMAMKYYMNVKEFRNNRLIKSFKLFSTICDNDPFEEE